MEIILSFDAGDTLFYGSASRCISTITGQSQSQVAQALKQAEASIRAKWEGIDIFATNSCISAYWADVYRAALVQISGEEDRVNQVYATLMYEREHGNWYQVREGVIPTLHDVSDRGYRVIASSNWSTDLERLLSRLGLADFFDAIYSSASLGFSKPSSHFYSTVDSVEQSQIFHFGDDEVNDVRAAERAGWHGILLRRSDSFDTIVSQVLARIEKDR